MAHVRPQFRLKNEKATEKTAIRLIAYISGERLVFAPDKSIVPALWDFKSQRPTKDRELIKEAQKSAPGIKAELDNIRARLDNVSHALTQKVNTLEAESTSLTKQILYDYLKTKFREKKAEKQETINLNAYIDKFIEGAERGKIKKQDKTRYAKGTVKNFKTFRAQFLLFQKESKQKLGYDNIKSGFYEDFVDWMNDKKYSPNTIGRHIKTLKMIMKHAKGRGTHNNTDFEGFKVLSVDVHEIYLTQDELQAIYNLKLEPFSEMDLVRDVFLVGCEIAQRYSDYSRINPDHVKRTFDGKKVIDLITKKNGHRVVIPVTPRLEYILSKHNYRLPKTHEQVVNRYIKKIGEKAGIKELVTIETIRGGEKKTKQMAKYEMIKTHTARRSGATNMYLAGIPTIDIMKITGHKTERNFLKYIKVTKEETASRLVSHPYFNQSNLKVSSNG